MSLEQQVLDKVQNIASSKKKKDDQKYQERLPWESHHISPYIPKLVKGGFKNDYYVPEIHNYEITKSFEPFLKNIINPIRQGEEDYSEYIKNLDEEEQARFTMDKFREFLSAKSRPQLSTESGLMNMRYRDKLINMLDQYQSGNYSEIKGMNNKPKNISVQQPKTSTQNTSATPAGKVVQVSTLQPNYSGTLPQSLNQSYNQLPSQNATPGNQYNSLQTSNIGAPLQQQQGGSISTNSQAQPLNKFASVAQGLINQQRQSGKDSKTSVQFQQIQGSAAGPTSSQVSNPMFSTQQQRQFAGSSGQQYSEYQQQQGNNPIQFSRNDLFNQKLCFNYEKLLTNEGKLKKGNDGQTWNNVSEQYMQRLFNWDGDSDNWIQDQLLQNKDVQTQFFLQPRVFRQVRPIDKVKKEVIKTTEGQYVPFETVVERRSVELMHQRDYLVRPSLIPNQYGELEILHDVFTYDRSFIVEQNPITKSEILHEYPVHLNEDQFTDFLFQTGIPVKYIDYFVPPPQQEPQTQEQQFNQTGYFPQTASQNQVPPPYQQRVQFKDNQYNTSNYNSQMQQQQPQQFVGLLQQQQQQSMQQSSGYQKMSKQSSLSQHQQQQSSQQEQLTSTLNYIQPEGKSSRKNTKKTTIVKDQTPSFDYEKHRRAELQKYFTDGKDTIKIEKKQPSIAEPFDYQGSKIMINNKESQMSFDNY